MVWKTVESQGKVSEKSGNFENDIQWQPWDGIEKSVPRDHCLSFLCKPRNANLWSSGQIFLSHTHDEFF